MTTDLILGTAGHIDHGKTSLIAALTGVNTDRLPEEKKRGITIELGFAELMLGPYRLGIVDVPGHEKFVRNMLAGATGMDLALLVVAADDSIKPQTREHLEILRLLDLPAGVIAITKSDLVEADWLDLVEEEIRGVVQDTFLQHAPIVRTSATTGSGMDELRDHLAAAADIAHEHQAARVEGPFRLAIDRTFTIAGHGTVVTGSVSNGRAKVGDELVIEPDSIAVRVRGLQNHDRTVDAIHRGQRAAINLAGIHHETVERGHELATPGHLKPSKLLTVHLRQIDDAPRPLRDRSRVRLHIGTAEVLARVRLLGQSELAPATSCFAQLFLSTPTVSTWNQPFVLRSESPVLTIGGGHVLDSDAERIRKYDQPTQEQLEAWRSNDLVERASSALYFAGVRGWDFRELPRSAGIDDFQPVADALRESGDLLEIQISPTRKLQIHQAIFERVCERIVAVMTKLHQDNPLRSQLDRSWIEHRFDYLENTALLNEAFKHLQRTKRLRKFDRGFALEGFGPRLSQNERKLLSWLIQQFQEAGLQAPTVDQLTKDAPRNSQSVPQLVALATADGDLVEIAQDYYVHRDAVDNACSRLQEAMASGEGKTLSEIRELLETTRKYAVPFCEYLDRVGFTARSGDHRILKSPPAAQRAVEAANPDVE